MHTYVHTHSIKFFNMRMEIRFLKSTIKMVHDEIISYVVKILTLYRKELPNVRSHE